VFDLPGHLPPSTIWYCQPAFSLIEKNAHWTNNKRNLDLKQSLNRNLYLYLKLRPSPPTY